MSASLCLMAWNEPIWRPNCSRDLAYSTDRSSRCCAAPTCSTASNAAPTCRAWVITRSASSGPASSRAGAPSSTTVACGRVRSMVTSGVRCTPIGGVHRVQAQARRSPLAAIRNTSAASASTTLPTVPVSGPPSAVTVTAARVERAGPVRRPRTPRCARPRPARRAPRRAPARPGRPPAPGWPDTPCRTAARRPAPPRTPRRRPPDRPAIRPTPPSASGTDMPSTPEFGPESPPHRGVEARLGLHQPAHRRLAEVVGAELAHRGAHSCCCSSVKANSTPAS